LECKDVTENEAKLAGLLVEVHPSQGCLLWRLHDSGNILLIVHPAMFWKGFGGRFIPECFSTSHQNMILFWGYIWGYPKYSQQGIIKYINYLFDYFESLPGHQLTFVNVRYNPQKQA
jgi:hypothetical protein